MKIKENYVLRNVGGNDAVYCEDVKDENFDKITVLNESAGWVWKEAKAQGDFTIESLTARICEDFDITAEMARSYVMEFLEKLDEEGMIEK